MAVVNVYSPTRDEDKYLSIVGVSYCGITFLGASEGVTDFFMTSSRAEMYNGSTGTEYLALIEEGDYALNVRDLSDGLYYIYLSIDEAERTGSLKVSATTPTYSATRNGFYSSEGKALYRVSVASTVISASVAMFASYSRQKYQYYTASEDWFRDEEPGPTFVPTAFELLEIPVDGDYKVTLHLETAQGEGFFNLEPLVFPGDNKLRIDFAGVEPGEEYYRETVIPVVGATVSTPKKLYLNLSDFDLSVTEFYLTAERI